MNEVSYHVVLSLTPEEVKRVKTQAIDLELTVKELVRQAILFYLVQFQPTKKED